MPIKPPASTSTKPAQDMDIGIAQASSKDSTMEPVHLLCPITRVMYRDPVFVAESGNTYKREAIEGFLHNLKRVLQQTL